MRSGWWCNGPECKAFNDAFADHLGVGHCIGVGNGTDALELALRVAVAARGMAPAQAEIVTVANAGGYTTTACRILGATPVYVDIAQDDQLMSVPAAVAAVGDRTAAVVATHLYGGMADVKGLRAALAAAGHPHVPVIEDCAQAHGLRAGGDRAGAMGDIATFSFYPTKNLGALGDGGAVVTDDAGHAAALRALHQYGWSGKYTVSTPYGRSSRLDEIQARLLTTMLPRLDDANERRRRILDAYVEAAPAGVHVVRSPIATVAHLAVVLTDDRDRLRAWMTERGVGVDVHYPILDCDQSGWRDMPMRIGPSGLAVSRASVARLLTLPCFPTMTGSEVNTVRDALASFKA